jgi:hypothetical protein
MGARCPGIRVGVVARWRVPPLPLTQTNQSNQTKLTKRWKGYLNWAVGRLAAELLHWFRMPLFGRCCSLRSVLSWIGCPWITRGCRCLSRDDLPHVGGHGAWLRMTGGVCCAEPLRRSRMLPDRRESERSRCVGTPEGDATSEVSPGGRFRDGGMVLSRGYSRG